MKSGYKWKVNMYMVLKTLKFTVNELLVKKVVLEWKIQ